MRGLGPIFCIPSTTSAILRVRILFQRITTLIMQYRLVLLEVLCMLLIL